MDRKTPCPRQTKYNQKVKEIQLLKSLIQMPHVRENCNDKDVTETNTTIHSEASEVLQSSNIAHDVLCNSGHDCVTCNEFPSFDNDELLFVTSQDMLSDIDSPVSPECDSIHSFLATWSIEYNISHLALTALLKGLNRWHPKLPLFASTLLKNLKSNTTVSQLQEGEFVYYGIRNQLVKLPEKYPRKSVSEGGGITIKICMTKHLLIIVS